jgi:hypothetical protein
MPESLEVTDPKYLGKYIAVEFLGYVDTREELIEELISNSEKVKKFKEK